MKYYTAGEVWEEFSKMSKPSQFAILYNALDHMSNDSSRTKLTCVALAMGYDNDTGEPDEFYKTSILTNVL
jgi:hypothetical protein